MTFEDSPVKMWFILPVFPTVLFSDCEFHHGVIFSNITSTKVKIVRFNDEGILERL